MDEHYKSPYLVGVFRSEPEARACALFELAKADAPCPPEYSDVVVFTHYSLPNGEIVKIQEELARGAATIDYTLKGGDIVTATRMLPCRSCGYRLVEPSTPCGFCGRVYIGEVK
jgi:hypothetical protein